MKTRGILILVWITLVAVFLAAASNGGSSNAMSDPDGRTTSSTDIGLLGPTPTSTPDPNSPWQPVGPGIDFQPFTLTMEDGFPNNIFVARMVRGAPDLFIESSIAQGRLSGGLETVGGMAARYGGAINYWGQQWGGRNEVVVAINGYFYDLDGTPARGQIHSGWYAKRFDDNESGSGFVWKLDGQAFIGECVQHPGIDQFIKFENGHERKFQGINVDRAEEELIIYTSQFGRNTPTDDSGVEILVELSRPMLIIPGETEQRAPVLGVIKAINDLQGGSLIPFDHIILSGHGIHRQRLLENAVVGEAIEISQSIKHLQEDCITPGQGDWTKAYASVGGGEYFLKDGEIQPPPDFNREPRTAIAYNDQYVFFIVVDGRQPRSVGMTYLEIGEFSLNLGATNAINQDGGGSSTMVINGEVVNLPSDTTEVPCNFVYLPILNGGKPKPSNESGAPPDEIVCTQNFSRGVANGMMMVVDQFPEYSSKFSQDDIVVTLSDANVRVGPGTNYAVISTLPAQTQGVVLEHANGMNGILAKGWNWWKVDFNGTSGWVAEWLIERP